MRRIKKRFFILMYCFAFIAVVSICQLGSNAVTVMTQSSPIKDRTIFIIDAGHGGVDGGATSCTGILESQINLEIACKINDLMHLLGYETKMVRTTDTSVYTEGNTIASQKVSDLKQRVRLVNDTENAILISIHQNTFADSRYKGAQVFYANNESSRKLAKDLQADMISALNPGSNRQCKPSDGIYLLQNIRRPGVLIECGFLSNPEEEAALRDAHYQNKMACVIVASICRSNSR